MTTGRLDDGRFEVPQEGDDDDARGGDAEYGQRGRHDGERAAPVHVLLDETEAAAPVGGRPPAAGTAPARVFVLDVGVVVARGTYPAARVTLLDALDESDIARPTALRLGHVVRTYKSAASTTFADVPSKLARIACPSKVFCALLNPKPLFLYLLTVNKYNNRIGKMSRHARGLRGRTGSGRARQARAAGGERRPAAGRN